LHEFFIIFFIGSPSEASAKEGGMPREAQGHGAIRFNPRHVSFNIEAGDFRFYPLADASA
jgi:hypothetical protein